MLHELDKFKSKEATLEREWVVIVQTPVDGVQAVVDAITQKISLVQGAYDCCMYIRSGGSTRFRSREGAHGGAEDVVRSSASSEIVFSIPPDQKILSDVFKTVFEVHVHEEPTIQIREVWGSRANNLGDSDNLNRYWNRTDAAAIHGVTE